MVSISPDRFWALTDSLIEDGYLPTENILVLNFGPKSNVLTVKEGNRRIAALKLIHGFLQADDIVVPDSTLKRIRAVSEQWKTANRTVPCTIYPAADAAVVERIVTLAHGKGQKAGRDQWNAVARARHNRDYNQAAEPALDMLERYLASGSNLTGQQRERWAGDYPITILEEVMKRIAGRLGAASAPDLAESYPKVSHRNALEDILRDIGLGSLSFNTVRMSGTDFVAKYGIPSAASGGGVGGTGSRTETGGSAGGGTGKATGAGGAGAGTASRTRTDTEAVSGSKAHAINNPLAVRKALKNFAPREANRAKIVTLRNEALKLELKDNPIAFCFLLRSMFAISAKLYASDHKLPLKCSKGKDKTLAELLKDCKNHITGGNNSSEMAKVLHGAQTELARRDGILSVTSMNQLVHNPTFSVQPPDISTLFGNIYPLLEAMN